MIDRRGDFVCMRVCVQWGFIRVKCAFTHTNSYFETINSVDTALMCSLL